MSAFSRASQLSRFRHMSTSAGTLNPLPASFLRGGTSKGIFINRSFLPEDRSEWDRIFLGIMGSPDPEYGRQLNGMGGGVSSLSKIVVVGLPQTPGADFDVEYTFAQVGIKDAVVDYSGNCGNLSSMVGVFAVDEGICKPRLVRTASAAESVLSRSSVRAFNTNTSKVVSTTFPVQEEEIGLIPELGVEEVSIAGVSGKSSSIILDFLRPAGARTGRLLPSGRASDTLTTRGGAGTSSFTASLVDATNPSVFIHHADLHCALHRTSSVQLDYNDSTTLDILESVRRAGAERMSLDPSAQAQPKIAVLSPPATGDTEADIVVYALSMGVLHKAIPMTLGLCLGVASNIRDSIPWKILQEQGKQDSSILRVRHPGGVVEVGAELGRNGEILSAKVVRTGRRLMEGFVWW